MVASGEHIDWLPSGSCLTRRMRCWIEALVQYLPIRHVSQLTGVGWHTIRGDRQAPFADHGVGTIELGEVRRLVMDEFALHKGTPLCHRDHGCRANLRPVGGGIGNSRAAIRPFFEQLGERCQQIEAVAMDMNTARSTWR